MVVIGIGFLLENAGIVAGSVLWPIGIIIVGLWMIFRHSYPVNTDHQAGQNK